MKGPEFKSGTNDHNLREEVVSEMGEEDYPLRRSVGMPAFESDVEMKKYMTERELAPERAEFKKKVLGILPSVFIEHHGRPSLGEAMKKRLSEDTGVPIENINVGVSKDFLGYWVEIVHPKYGNLDFDFTD